MLFDGHCNLCSRGVAFIIRRDPDATFRFAPLQSQVAQELLERAGAREPPDSMAVIDGGRALFRSAAALRIARGLRWPWPLLTVFWIVPGPLRNWLYRFVARNRYRWFGRREACMTPTPELESRFVATS